MNMLRHTLPHIMITVMLSGLVVAITADRSAAQEIDFGTYVPDDGRYEITVTAEEHLDFGTVVSGFPSVTIGLQYPDAAIVSIDAVRYLDVFVDITDNPQYLWLDGLQTEDDTKRIPLELTFGYINTENGLADTPQQFFSTMARFPVRQRPGGPPAPPPTPPHSGYQPPRAMPYIVIGGTLGHIGGNIPDNLDAGNYSAQIRVEVTYDL